MLLYRLIAWVLIPAVLVAIVAYSLSGLHDLAVALSTGTPR